MKNTDEATLDKLIMLVKNNGMPISFIEKAIEEFEINEIIAGKEFDLTVDYSRSLEEMFLAGKFYKVFWSGKDWSRIRDYSTKIPDLKGGKTITVRAKVFNFYDYENKYNLPTYDEAKEAVIKEGYELGTTEQLLSLAEAHPGLQEKITVVAFGSTIKVVDAHDKNQIDTCYPYIYYSWQSGFRGSWVGSFDGKTHLEGPNQRHCDCLLGIKVVS